MSTAKKQFLKDVNDPNTVIFPKTTIDQVLSADGTTPWVPTDNGQEITQAEYDKLTPEQKANGDYYITDANGNATVIDTALSTTSINPVQNKVVTEAINSVNSKIANKTESSMLTGLTIEYNANTVSVDYSAKQTISAKTWLNNFIKLTKKPINNRRFIVYEPNNGIYVGFGIIDTDGNVSVYNSTTATITNIGFSITYLYNN